MHTPGTKYSTYIVTNPNKTTLYTGVTNNLPARLIEHWMEKGQRETFTGRYFCFNLVYFELFQFIDDAIKREKEIKKWNRSKKEALIKTINPEWNFLNEKVCGEWPPKNIKKRF